MDAQLRHEIGTNPTVSVEVADISGQKVLRVDDVPADSTGGELKRWVLSQWQLPLNDPNGRPVTYHARLEREGRKLHDSERVGDALLPSGDRLTLQPNVDAGDR